jgi:hypothetical protein
MAFRPMTEAYRKLSIASYRKRIAEAEARLGGPGSDELLLKIDEWRGYVAKLESSTPPSPS